MHDLYDKNAWEWKGMITPDCTDFAGCLVYGTTIVHLPRVDKLPASAYGDLLGVWLVPQGLYAGLDRVHGVAGAGHLSREVMNARGAGYLEEAVGNP